MEQHNSPVEQLRSDTSTKTECRRQIAALSAIGTVDFSIISLYQLGYIKHLPDVPHKIFDSDKVNASEEAVMLGIPDGVISLGMYAGAMLLATAASSRKKHAKWLDKLLVGVVLGQAAGAAFYLYNMVKVQKKACLYCIAGALINFAAVKPALTLLTEK